MGVVVNPEGVAGITTRQFGCTTRQFECATMATLNEDSDTKARTQLAKEWLQEHENESIATAARIFKLNRTSLSYSIRKANNRPSSRGGLNRILTTS